MPRETDRTEKTADTENVSTCAQAAADKKVRRRPVTVCFFRRGVYPSIPDGV